MGVPTTVTISSSPDSVIWRATTSSSSAYSQQPKRLVQNANNKFARGGGGSRRSSSLSSNNSNNNKASKTKAPTTSLFLVVLCGLLASFQLVHYMSYMANRFSSSDYPYLSSQQQRDEGAVVTVAALASSSFATTRAASNGIVPIDATQTATLSSTRASSRRQLADITNNKNKKRQPQRRKHSLASSLHATEPYDVLVVVPGLGDARRLDTLEKSLVTLSSSLNRRGFGFSCQVYVWNASLLELAQERLGSNNTTTNCHVQASEGMWTHHMSRVPDLSSTNVTHVAVLMDDVDVSSSSSKFCLSDFLHLMSWSGFGVASPAFSDPIYPSMHARYNCFFHRTDHVNILFTVFTRQVWNCWQHNMIDTVRNPLGWGMDVALHSVCNTTLGVMDAYKGVHRSSVTSYSQDEARNQMYEYIARKVLVDNDNGKKETKLDLDGAKKYLECAGQKRPAAFEECQVYWDGSEANQSRTVDWTCA